MASLGLATRPHRAHGLHLSEHMFQKASALHGEELVAEQFGKYLVAGPKHSTSWCTHGELAMFNRLGLHGFECEYEVNAVPIFPIRFDAQNPTVRLSTQIPTRQSQDKAALKRRRAEPQKSLEAAVVVCTA